jgi:saccharopine dehydrogenase (NAD+, L-lysine forming)
MTKIRIGIIQERKSPPDFRTPLTPSQCAGLLTQFPELEILVESSPNRCFSDDDYTKQGIKVTTDISQADVLFGIKEVPIDALIPYKTYFFFSHTIKKQPYNAKLLRAVLDKKIELIDYEALKGKDGKRIIGFGRYAGIVGVYEGIRAFGAKQKLFELPSPQTLSGRIEFDSILSKADVSQIRAVVTGWGRVGSGAEEVLSALNLKRLTADEFLKNPNELGVYTHIDTPEMYIRITDGGFDKKEFYANPNLYTSNLGSFVSSCNLYFAAHLWRNENPVLLTKEFFQTHKNCKVVADISCDLNGPLACTIRASKISSPIYGYNPSSGLEDAFDSKEAIAVMAIDNLPCELPKDSSEDFGNEIVNQIIPRLLNGDDGILNSGRETTKLGELTESFNYLKEYATAR